MACFYCGSVQEFLAEEVEAVLARLAVAYASRGYTRQYAAQTLTWQRDLQHLRRSLEECVARSNSAMLWGLLLEFSIPRKELRIDIVLLIRSLVVVIEAKSGSAFSEATRQIEEYAMLLHYFHKATADRRVLPVIVSSDVVEREPGNPGWSKSYRQTASYWVAPTIRISWPQLAGLLTAVEELGGGDQISSGHWNDSPYFPVPSIIEAALSL
jgi:hypothetical protein